MQWYKIALKMVKEALKGRDLYDFYLLAYLSPKDLLHEVKANPEFKFYLIDKLQDLKERYVRDGVKALNAELGYIHVSISSEDEIPQAMLWFNNVNEWNLGYGGLAWGDVAKALNDIHNYPSLYDLEKDPNMTDQAMVKAFYDLIFLIDYFNDVCHNNGRALRNMMEDMQSHVVDDFLDYKKDVTDLRVLINYYNVDDEIISALKHSTHGEIPVSPEDACKSMIILHKQGSLDLETHKKLEDITLRGLTEAYVKGLSCHALRDHAFKAVDLNCIDKDKLYNIIIAYDPVTGGKDLLNRDVYGKEYLIHLIQQISLGEVSKLNRTDEYWVSEFTSMLLHKEGVTQDDLAQVALYLPSVNLEQIVYAKDPQKSNTVQSNEDYFMNFFMLIEAILDDDDASDKLMTLINRNIGMHASSHRVIDSLFILIDSMVNFYHQEGLHEMFIDMCYKVFLKMMPQVTAIDLKKTLVFYIAVNPLASPDWMNKFMVDIIIPSVVHIFTSGAKYDTYDLSNVAYNLGKVFDISFVPIEELTGMLMSKIDSCDIKMLIAYLNTVLKTSQVSDVVTYVHDNYPQSFHQFVEKLTQDLSGKNKKDDLKELAKTVSKLNTDDEIANISDNFTHQDSHLNEVITPDDTDNYSTPYEVDEQYPFLKKPHEPELIG